VIKIIAVMNIVKGSIAAPFFPAYVALYVRYGELKKAQRMSRPAVKGNVSCAGEGAITAGAAL
jgi:hypothetical protein